MSCRGPAKPAFGSPVPHATGHRYRILTPVERVRHAWSI